MSSAHNEHESAIKTPKQLAVAVFAAFAVPIICIILLVIYVTGDMRTGAGSQGHTPEAIASRIHPVADDGYKLNNPNAVKELQSGEAVYTASCAACHGTGAAGAPKIGDNAGWSARIALGYEGLLKSAIAGKGAMPAKGGNADLDDVEIGRAIVHMANKSGAKFAEPAVKQASGAAASASASASVSTSTSADASVPGASAHK